MIRVISAVRGKVECHRKTLLAGGEVAAIERIGLCSGGETGILADSPRAQGVHGAVRATQERRYARHIVEMLKTFKVGLGIDWFYRNKLGSGPVFGINGRRCGAGRPGGDIDIFKIGFHNSCDGYLLRRRLLKSRSVSRTLQRT